MERIDEIASQADKQSTQSEPGILDRLSSSRYAIVTFGLLMIFITWVYFQDHPGQANQEIFAYILIGALAILITTSDFVGKKLLTEQQCKAKLYQLVKWKLRNRTGDFKEIPEGLIKIEEKGRLRFWEGRPWKRVTGFSIITNSGFSHQYYAEQEPFTGDLIGIIPGYFDPREETDVRRIPFPVRNFDEWRDVESVRVGKSKKIGR